MVYAIEQNVGQYGHSRPAHSGGTMDQDGWVLVPANPDDLGCIGADMISQSRQLFQEIQKCSDIGGTTRLAPVGVL